MVVTRCSTPDITWMIPLIRMFLQCAEVCCIGLHVWTSPAQPAQPAQTAQPAQFLQENHAWRLEVHWATSKEVFEAFGRHFVGFTLQSGYARLFKDWEWDHAV